ncbi:hypothetical protein [Variovorax saccharolyticus]|uniref:hypothetical protein n=1 Tax=Variovorax saccharolyticus TaxID=3053516 RepID=UPI0025778008|nr:hypothetical protein [Variovorax sp. J31P216]MDM0030453.1 hypothetical protein [Variovorax sp. J31P216]
MGLDRKNVPQDFIFALASLILFISNMSGSTSSATSAISAQNTLRLQGIANEVKAKPEEVALGCPPADESIPDEFPAGASLFAFQQDGLGHTMRRLLASGGARHGDAPAPVAPVISASARQELLKAAGMMKSMFVAPDGDTYGKDGTKLASADHIGAGVGAHFEKVIPTVTTSTLELPTPANMNEAFLRQRDGQLIGKHGEELSTGGTPGARIGAYFAKVIPTVTTSTLELPTTANMNEAFLRQRDGKFIGVHGKELSTGGTPGAPTGAALAPIAQTIPPRATPLKPALKKPAAADTLAEGKNPEPKVAPAVPKRVHFPENLEQEAANRRQEKDKAAALRAASYESPIPAILITSTLPGDPEVVG